MEDSLKNIISDIRVFLNGGMTSLPLALAGTMLLIGLFTAHYAMLFFLVGFLIVVPFTSWGINSLASVLSEETLKKYNLKSKRSDICRVIIPFETLKTNTQTTNNEEVVVFSEWLSMISFFIGYILHNSWTMYERSPIDGAEQDKVSTRKTQALLSLISIVVFACVVMYYRYYTGCEGWSILATVPIFGAIGWGWYQMLSGVAQPDQLSDLFGIANRILPAAATKNGPMACIPVGDASLPHTP